MQLIACARLTGMKYLCYEISDTEPQGAMPDTSNRQILQKYCVSHAFLERRSTAQLFALFRANSSEVREALDKEKILVFFPANVLRMASTSLSCCCAMELTWSSPSSSAHRERLVFSKAFTQRVILLYVRTYGRAITPHFQHRMASLRAASTEAICNGGFRGSFKICARCRFWMRRISSASPFWRRPSEAPIGDGGHTAEYRCT
ncbi:hypothetical protein [Acetobacter senegalensis]|uniref:hypothetical protein n=1 Tax=Acetobacter senegalensis TaxID=446692 RepID=UPI0012E8F6D5|nr:hypothetical protein [Acetobacter senegalensis]